MAKTVQCLFKQQGVEVETDYEHEKQEQEEGDEEQENVPSPKPDAPQTGDTFPVRLWVVVMCISGLVLIIIGIGTRRRK